MSDLYSLGYIALRRLRPRILWPPDRDPAMAWIPSFMLTQNTDNSSNNLIDITTRATDRSTHPVQASIKLLCELHREA
jgi:hypothetical protein